MQMFEFLPDELSVQVKVGGSPDRSQNSSGSKDGHISRL